MLFPQQNGPQNTPKKKQRRPFLDVDFFSWNLKTSSFLEQLLDIN